MAKKVHQYGGWTIRFVGLAWEVIRPGETEPIRETFRLLSEAKRYIDSKTSAYGDEDRPANWKPPEPAPVTVKIPFTVQPVEILSVMSEPPPTPPPDPKEELFAKVEAFIGVEHKRGRERTMEYMDVGDVLDTLKRLFIPRGQYVSEITTRFNKSYNVLKRAKRLSDHRELVEGIFANFPDENFGPRDTALFVTGIKKYAKSLNRQPDDIEAQRSYLVEFRRRDGLELPEEEELEEDELEEVAPPDPGSDFAVGALNPELAAKIPESQEERRKLLKRQEQAQKLQEAKARKKQLALEKQARDREAFHQQSERRRLEKEANMVEIELEAIVRFKVRVDQREWPRSSVARVVETDGEIDITTEQLEVVEQTITRCTVVETPQQS